jgi:hemerythrin
VPDAHEEGQEKTAVWSEAYELGIPLIDGQHKKLIEQLGSLLKALKTRRKERSVRESLEFLDTYTNDHFYTEERLLREQGYPDLEAHLEAHKYFRDTVVKAKNFIRVNPDSEKSVQLVQSLLINWFVKHIKGTDQDYVALLKKQG